MTDASSALQTLQRDLGEIFGPRLQALVHYAAHAHKAASHHRKGHHGEHEAPRVHTLAVVDTLTADDLRACARRVEAWHGEGLATPLLLPDREIGRSLDVFPFEFSSIMADHVLVSGRNPFDGLHVESNDLRRACEVQARGHLLHLREGLVETRGRDDALAVLIVRSAPAWASLLENMARLEQRAAESDEVTKLVGVKEISNDEAARIFPAYLSAVERLTNRVDAWSGHEG
jgi:hypothetical protein